LGKKGDKKGRRSKSDRGKRKGISELALLIKKLNDNSGKTPDAHFTESEVDLTNDKEGVNSQDSSSAFTSSEFLTLSESMHTKYDQLKDDTSNQISEVRNLIDKVKDDYVKWKVFVWSLGGIVSFALIMGAIIYNLSYAPLLKKTNQVETEQSNVNDSIETIHDKLKGLQEDFGNLPRETSKDNDR